MIIWSYDHKIIWWYDHMIISYDHMIIWPFDDMIAWSYDHMIICCYDQRIIWAYDHMSIWSYDHMVIWSYDLTTIWSYDHMFIWSYDHMNIWSYDRMNMWSTENSTNNRFQGRKMKCWESSETRFGQVSGRSELSSGGKQPVKVCETFVSFSVEKWNVGDRLKRVLAKFRADRSQVWGVNGRSKFVGDDVGPFSVPYKV